jgi:RNA polymerase sigma-70 factor (ECF subfamily)
LPADQREVFLLREEGGFTLEEIGTITGTGRETVKSRLRYALRKLRTCVPKRETLGVDND